MLFTSCTTSPAPVVSPTALPSETPQPTQTSTETPTLTPTATENPLAGAPEGTTGKNSNGEWIKIVSNVTYVYKTIADPKRNVMLTQGWFKDTIVNPTYKDGIPLMDEPNSGFPTYMALHVWCREEVQCPSLQHLLITTPLNNDLTFTKLLVTKIHDMYNNTYPDLHAFITQVLSAGKVSIPYKTAYGDTYEYRITPQTCINIYVVKEMSNPELTRLDMNSILTGDNMGNLNIVVYSSIPIESLSHLNYMDLILLRPFLLLFTGDQSKGNLMNNMSNPYLAKLV